MSVTCATTAQPRPTLIRSVNLKSQKIFKSYFFLGTSDFLRLYPSTDFAYSWWQPQNVFFSQFWWFIVFIYCGQRRSTILNPVLSLVELNLKMIVNISLSREASGNEIGMTSPVACNVALLLVYLFMYLLICLSVFVRVTRMVMAGEMRATWIEISEWM